MGREAIRTVQTARVIAKGETTLQSMIDRFVEIGKCYEMGMNVKKKNLR
jgi:hypothetical protein